MDKKSIIRPKLNRDCDSRPVPHWLIHDLLQPLSACGLAVEQLRDLLGESLASDHEAFFYLDLLGRAVQSEKELLSSLRQYWHQVRNATPPHFHEVELKEVIVGVVDRCREAFPSIAIDIPNVEGVRVLSDFVMLSEMLWRVTENAAQHARSRVFFTTEQSPLNLFLAIHDDGNGLAPDIVNSLGMPFLRNRINQRISHHGLGLGISIAAAIAKKLRHPLSATSILGDGCQFSIGLTIAHRDGARGTHLPEDSMYQARIAVAERNDRSETALNSLLSSWGCNTRSVTIHSAADATAITEYAPDLLIVDYDLWRAICEAVAVGSIDKRSMTFRLIVLVNNAEQRAASSTIRSGGHQVTTLRRPISPSRLRSTLLAALSPLE